MTMTDAVEAFLAAVGTQADTEWMRDAACRGMDPSLFYPERGQSVSHIKAVCAACPVRAKCAEAGRREKYGVWGGLSERARRALRKQLYEQETQRLVAQRQQALVDGDRTAGFAESVNCGTVGGVTMHRRRHEAVCAACREAYRVYRHQWERGKAG